MNEITIGDFTKPIITSGGFLILKINDVKTENVKIDKEAQLKKMIDFERQRQLTRLSTLYYKRIYNSAEINENKPVIIICDPKSTFNEILIKTSGNKVLKLKFPIIIVCSKKYLKLNLKS